MSGFINRLNDFFHDHSDKKKSYLLDVVATEIILQYLTDTELVFLYLVVSLCRTISR